MGFSLPVYMSKRPFICGCTPSWLRLVWDSAAAAARAASLGRMSIGTGAMVDIEIGASTVHVGISDIEMPTWAGVVVPVCRIRSFCR